MPSKFRVQLKLKLYNNKKSIWIANFAFVHPSTFKCWHEPINNFSLSRHKCIHSSHSPHDAITSYREHNGLSVSSHVLCSSAPEIQPAVSRVCKASLECYLELCHECDLQLGLAAQNQQIVHFGSSTSSQSRHHRWLQTTHSCLLQSHNQQLKKRNETFLDSVHIVPCFAKVAIKWLCPQHASLGTKSHQKKKKIFPGLKTGHALHTRNGEVRFSEIHFPKHSF